QAVFRAGGNRAQQALESMQAAMHISHGNQTTGRAHAESLGEPPGHGWRLFRLSSNSIEYKSNPPVDHPPRPASAAGPSPRAEVEWGHRIE
ncbi:MAG: hypothetical protein ACK56I_19985, partial [bacterium]